MTDEGRQGGKHDHSVRQVLSVFGTTAGAEGLQWRWLSLSEDADTQRSRNRSLNGNTESLQKFVLSLTIVVLRLFCSLRFILCLKLVTMSGATSDQLHRSTLSVYVVSLFCLFLWILFMLWTRWLDCSISNWSNCCWTVFSGVFVNMYFTLFVCVCVFYCRTWWSTSILACRSSSL